MRENDDMITATFSQSGERVELKTADLENAIFEFIEHHATPYLVGDEFCNVIGTKGGVSEKFERLLRSAGFSDDPKGFIKTVAGLLEKAQSDGQADITIGGVTLPYLLLMAILGKMIPGNKFILVRNVDQVEKLANISIPEENRNDIQKVIDTYPVSLSHHTIRQMRLSRNVAYQYLPFLEELDPVGHANTWIGQFHQGLLEQMYQNRVIFLLNMSCPVYCRFCFRKHKESRNQSNPSVQDVRRAVEHVKNTPTIKEIVITGGDPFLHRTNMAHAIDGLKLISHVQTLRLATRSIAYYPDLFLGHDGELLNYLKMKNLELRHLGKRMEVATHFIHPDEISIESLDIISDLVKNGIAVYVQTPFLKDCNDQGPELTRLFSLLRGAGAELHYIYIPCSPIHGNSVYWAPLSKGLDVAKYLRAHLSDRVMPRICTATAIGKIDWHSSGWAVKPDENEDQFLWIRTPYTPGYFKAFAPLASELDIVKVNDEGTIDVRYMAQIGDEDLFLGSRPPVKRKAFMVEENALENLGQEALKDQMIRLSIVKTPTDKIFRSHETRVELDANGGDAELDYIRKDNRITDVVICSKKDLLQKVTPVSKLVEKLQAISHVNAVRLRSLWFNYRPDRFTKAVIDRLGSLNRLEIAQPLRLEIETQFLSILELNSEHQRLARMLSNRGITVYANTPLLEKINDCSEEISSMAFKLREMGIEFHQLYMAGLPIQKRRNGKNPVDIADVIDIGSQVRREGSGREIPRYVIATVLGEVDFGLTSKLFKENGEMKILLTPYDLDYYRALDLDFKWPEGTETDSRNRPILPVEGLKDTGGFMVFDRARVVK